jgi:phosphoglucomutase
VSLVKKGKQGAAEISTLMDEYRLSPPSEIGGVAVLETADYKTGTVKDSTGTLIRKIDLPSSNVIQFTLTDGSKVTARPSGTEPKIKYYVSLRQEMAGQSFERSWSAAGDKIEAIKQSLGI